jgi:hypothetical protein
VECGTRGGMVVFDVFGTCELISRHHTHMRRLCSGKLSLILTLFRSGGCLSNWFPLLDLGLQMSCVFLLCVRSHPLGLLFSNVNSERLTFFYTEN